MYLVTYASVTGDDSYLYTTTTPYFDRQKALDAHRRNLGCVAEEVIPDDFQMLDAEDVDTERETFVEKNCGNNCVRKEYFNDKYICQVERYHIVDGNMEKDNTFLGF